MESKSVKETQKIASGLAHKISKSSKGAVIALEGELGAGKTTFIKGFAKALGVKDKVKSPTFVLMKKYELTKSLKLKAKSLYHLDCYRVGDEKDLKIPELKEILKEPHNMVVIEWAERVKKILPKNHIKIHIDHVDKNKRKIIVTDNF